LWVEFVIFCFLLNFTIKPHIEAYLYHIHQIIRGLKLSQFITKAWYVGKTFVVENLVLCSKSRNNPHTRLISLWCARIRRVTVYTCAMAEETREFETDSFVCGYHVCWTRVIWEKLVCEREEGNPRDRYAAAIKKVVTIVDNKWPCTA